MTLSHQELSANYKPQTLHIFSFDEKSPASISFWLTKQVSVVLTLKNSKCWTQNLDANHEIHTRWNHANSMTQTRSKVKTKSEEKCDAKELRGDKAEQYVIVQQRYGRYFWAHTQVPQTWGSQIRVAFPGVCTSRLAELKCTLQTRVVFLGKCTGRLSVTGEQRPRQYFGCMQNQPAMRSTFQIACTSSLAVLRHNWQGQYIWVRTHLA